MDINKAFDSVWHKGLLYKLHRLNTSKYLLYTIRNLLENRQLHVRIDNTLSFAFSSEQGLLQGAPLPYNIYFTISTATTYTTTTSGTKTKWQNSIDFTIRRRHCTYCSRQNYIESSFKTTITYWRYHDMVLQMETNAQRNEKAAFITKPSNKKRLSKHNHRRPHNWS